MIIGAGGFLSGGKTVTFVSLCVQRKLFDPSLRIITNVELDGIEHIYLSSNQFIELIMSHLEDTKFLEEFFTHSILFLDEIRNLLSARQSMHQINEVLTQFLMMTGKLSCTVYYTYQILNSQVDLQLREITQYNLVCKRVDKLGRDIISHERCVDQKVYILAKICNYKGEDLVYTGRYFIVDPEPYYSYYRTKQILLVDREKYKKKQ